jgi:hypothetical protein
VAWCGQGVFILSPETAVRGVVVTQLPQSFQAAPSAQDASLASLGHILQAEVQRSTCIHTYTQLIIHSIIIQYVGVNYYVNIKSE